MPEPWDVREFAGKKAHIEIVDEQNGAVGTHQHRPDRVLRRGHEPGDAEAAERASAAASPRSRRRQAELDDLARTGAKNDLPRFEVNKPLGKGQVVVAAGSILDPSQIGSAGARQRAYQALCELAGATYTLPEGIPPSACGFGTLALVALADNVTVLPAFEDWNVAWEQFKAKGAFEPVDQAKANAPTPAGKTVNGAVAATVEVPAGGSVEVPFLLAWHYPNKYSAQPDINYGTPSR